MYLKAFFGRGDHSANYPSAMHIPETLFVKSSLLPQIMVLSNDRLLVKTGSSIPTTSIPFQHYSIQITALRAVKCKAIVYEFYEGCRQKLLGSGSHRCTDSCPYLNTRLNDIPRN